MEVKDRNILDKFCTDFCKIVEKHCKYAVVSGFVAISSGRTRGTEDIDIILEKISLGIFGELHKDLVQNEFECIQTDNYKEMYNNYLKTGVSLRYIRRDIELPQMEVKMSKDELDDYQIGTRIKLPKTGLDVWFSSINMNIAFKEYNLGGKKDFEDAIHLRKIYPELVDESEIDKIRRMLEKYRSVDYENYKKIREKYPLP